jgi:hypothetical protein
MCSAANPENPNVEDSYQYGINGLTKQGLLQTTRTKSSYSEDFSLGDINLPDATKFIEKAKQRVNMPDATVSLVRIRRETKSVMDKTFRTEWDVSLKKGVNEGSVYYDNGGNEFRVIKNGKVVSREK